MKIKLVIYCDWSIIRSQQVMNTVGIVNATLKSKFATAASCIHGASTIEDMTTEAKQEAIDGLYLVDVDVTEDLEGTVASMLTELFGILWKEFVRTFWSSSGTIVLRLRYKCGLNKRRLHYYPQN